MSLPLDGKFRAGDRVRIGAWEGVLPELNDEGFFMVFPSAGFSEFGCYGYFPNEAQINIGPLMQFVERPKRKVKRAVCLLSGGQWVFRAKGEGVSYDPSVLWQGEIEVESDE